jgi:glycoprotein endo-alpha-1,2-mannosidase
LLPLSRGALVSPGRRGPDPLSGASLAPGARAVRLWAVRAIVLGLLPLGLAAGLWRAERDQPLWLVRAGRPPAFDAPGSRPASQRLVLAVHYPWYGTPAGPTGRWRHWNHARLEMPEGRLLGFHDPRRLTGPGRRDIGATNYPDAGPYDSRDPARIRAQLALVRDAGLDGFAVSWWGRESEEALGLAALFPLARQAGLVLAPYYETGELWRRGALGVADDLISLLDRHGSEPAWLRVGGIPVVFLYASHRLRPRMWDAVRARLQATRRRLYLVADAPSPEWLSTRPDWLSRFDALHVYTPIVFLARGRVVGDVYQRYAALARWADRPFIPAVAPGFDDRQVRTPGTVVERAEGATYDETWRAARSVDPPWILVSSWNEWHEGSEIEPSAEHGRRYLDATRAWAERFRQGAP